MYAGSFYPFYFIHSFHTTLITLHWSSGQKVVCEVMRRILAARAIHNVFSTTELRLSTSNSHLILSDGATKTIRLQHRLSDVAYWATHSENHKWEMVFCSLVDFSIIMILLKCSVLYYSRVFTIFTKCFLYNVQSFCHTYSRVPIFLLSQMFSLLCFSHKCCWNFRLASSFFV